MASPLMAWSITIIAIVLTGLFWFASAPIVSSLFTATSSMSPEEAQGPRMTLRLQFIAIPIVICILMIAWSYLVTTRRQTVTRGFYD